MTDATAETSAPIEASGPRRPAVRVGILSHGTSQFDSRAHRIARSLAAAGDTVTLYSRHRPGLPIEETLDGYRIVRIAVSQRSLREAIAELGDDIPPSLAGLAERAAIREGGAPAAGTEGGQGELRERQAQHPGPGCQARHGRPPTGPAPSDGPRPGRAGPQGMATRPARLSGGP